MPAPPRTTSSTHSGRRVPILGTMTRIAVTTPTGNVGSRVARLLVQAGVRPVLLLRDAAKLDPALRERCETRELDQSDSAAVVRATRDISTLYWVNPPTQEDDPVAGSIRMGESAAAAVRANGISRVVFQSSGGAEKRSGVGEIDGLGRTEELLDATGADVTHLRCGYFFTNLLLDLDAVRAGQVGATLPVDFALPWVAPRDIGDVAAARLLSTGWHGRHTLGVHGPADLSFGDVAKVLSAALGTEIRAVQHPEDAVAGELRGFGLTEAQIEAVLGMSRGMLDLVPENPREMITTTPTTLGSWAWAELRPLV